MLDDDGALVIPDGPDAGVVAAVVQEVLHQTAVVEHPGIAHSSRTEAEIRPAGWNKLPTQQRIGHAMTTRNMDPSNYHHWDATVKTYHSG